MTQKPFSFIQNFTRVGHYDETAWASHFLRNCPDFLNLQTIEQLYVSIQEKTLYN